MRYTLPHKRVAQLWATRSHIKSSVELAQSWLAHRHHPGDAEMLNRFGGLANVGLRRHLPNGSRGGALRGLEADIRQEAFLILNRYLRGNPEVAKAELRGDLQELERLIHQCLRIATSIASKRMARASAALRDGSHEEVRVKTEPSTLHPYDVTQEADLSEGERRSLALAAVDEAVRAGALSLRDAEMVRSRIEQGLSQADYARQQGVSREAIHQREVRAVRVLRRTVRKTEVPSQ